MTPVSVGDLRAPTAMGLSVRTVVGCACGAVILARLVFLWEPLRSDEGGYLLAARNWHTGGEFLYGGYHVDRPPLLMLIFRLAALSHWDRTIRILSIPSRWLWSSPPPGRDSLRRDHARRGGAPSSRHP